MNKTLFTLLMSAGLISNADAQRVVYDRRHLLSVNENAVARHAAELNHNQYLEKIDQNLKTINLNVGSVVTVPSIIYDGLSNINSALNNGLAVRQLGDIVADLVNYSNQMVAMGRPDPYLLLFAEDFRSQMRGRCTRLVTEVSGIVLKEGSNVLADYNFRDQLLRKITQELQLLVSLAYGAWKAMYRAKERGVMVPTESFAAYVNQDRQYEEDIIRNVKYLK